MSKRPVVILVLGLGEAAPIYSFLTRSWPRRYGVTPIIHVMGWKNVQEPFKPKLDRLVRLIEKHGKTSPVSLIGISAGASASLNADERLKKKNVRIASLTMVCGRFNFRHHPWYPLSYGVKRAPAFEESVTKAQASLKNLPTRNLSGIDTYASFFDEVVPRRSSLIPGARQRIIPAASHVLGIYTFLLFLPKAVRSRIVVSG